MPEIKKYLNRDGLEEYNDLLPHSAGAMQEYVDAWLDDHPEATTTVQDGAVTTAKLADKSVTRNKLADDVSHLLGGMMLTKEVSGDLLNTDDAYSVAPLSFSIDGRSTQNGTPTPESPVAIDSIEVLDLLVTFAGKNLWGGEKLKSDVMVNASGSTTGADDNGQYVQFSLTGNTGKAICKVPFKASTQYTFLLYVVRTGSTSANCNLQIKYTDGTSANLQRAVPESVTAASYTNFVSAAGKTVQGIYIQNHGGSTRLYYDQCGIFEGAYALADFVPYEGITAHIPMQGHVLRSLPSGYKDLLYLEYLRASTRAGYGIYHASISQVVGSVDLGSLTWAPRANQLKWYTDVPTLRSNTTAPQRMCSSYTVIASQGTNSTPENNTISPRSVANVNSVYLRDDRYPPDSTDPADFKTALNGVIFTFLMNVTDYQTHDLGEVELPALLGPICNIYSDPITGLHMEYMRDANIVISDIEAAIADL